MKGARAVFWVSTNRAPNSTMKSMMGKSHHFFRTRMKLHSSERMSSLLIEYQYSAAARASFYIGVIQCSSRPRAGCARKANSKVNEQVGQICPAFGGPIKPYHIVP